MTTRPRKYFVASMIGFTAVLAGCTFPSNVPLNGTPGTPATTCAALSLNTSSQTLIAESASPLHITVTLRNCGSLPLQRGQDSRCGPGPTLRLVQGNAAYDVPTDVTNQTPTNTDFYAASHGVCGMIDHAKDLAFSEVAQDVATWNGTVAETVCTWHNTTQGSESTCASSATHAVAGIWQIEAHYGASDGSTRDEWTATRSVEVITSPTCVHCALVTANGTAITPMAPCMLTGRGDVPAGPDCSLEWLNVTIEPHGAGHYQVGVPAPAFGLHRLITSWAHNATIEGNGTMNATDFGAGPVMLVEGSGPITLRSRLVTGPEPETGAAEGYLRARWTTNPSDDRPTAIRVWLNTGPNDSMAFTIHVNYDAFSRWCGRHATFAGDGTSGDWASLPGTDGATCS